MPAESIERAFLDAAAHRLEDSTVQIEHCLCQLDEEQLWWRAKPDLNSIGNLVLHLCGNVGQWIVSGVGGRADVRNRPSEFDADIRTPKAELHTQLRTTVEQAKNTLSAMDGSRLTTDCRIQGFDTNVLSAILDTVSHFQGHTQEIILLTRRQLGPQYQFHFVPSTPEQVSAR